MSKLILPFLLVVLIGSACSGAVETPGQVVLPSEQDTKPAITVFRPPT